MKISDEDDTEEEENQGRIIQSSTVAAAGRSLYIMVRIENPSAYITHPRRVCENATRMNHHYRYCNQPCSSKNRTSSISSSLLYQATAEWRQTDGWFPSLDDSWTSSVRTPLSAPTSHTVNTVISTYCVQYDMSSSTEGVCWWTLDGHVAAIMMRICNSTPVHTDAYNIS